MEIDENNEELFEHFSFSADKGQEPIRVDKFLMNRIENATRNKTQKVVIFFQTTFQSSKTTRLNQVIM